MTKTDNAFLDVHVLHAVPFSNLNRDNLGTPKQMVYGGATRARISSQCTKRAARLWLEQNTDLGIALRTRRLPQIVRERLVQAHDFTDDGAIAATERVFGLAGIKIKGPEDEEPTEQYEMQGDQLTFTTAEAAAVFATRINEHRNELLADEFKPASGLKKALLRLFDDGSHTPIIALCGRMLAALPETNVDGALQVAHAFTTHTSTLELDYFTAVDDQVQRDDGETGAGHINVGEYTSGVFYRHATIGLRQLSELLDGSDAAVAEVVGSFIRAFALAEPTGKQNSANAHTRPDLMAVTLRSDRPVSFAAAFEKPVEPGRNGGFMNASIEALHRRAALENQMYGTEGLIDSWYVESIETPDASGLGDPLDSLNDLVRVVEHNIAPTTTQSDGERDAHDF
ncbi:MAG: type I-E CRISPR-associated protein Cas7/Cse4/CasC [Acidimicrobiales bacterium]|nr:type I-E CRISPR-associated protein Cas7/Cse4/CasC [Acidimicrobiales bacterium]MYA38871.1 type I-E CRISPR-associated protein Cas7/Cse4/CasC [Acidimicrobiia bacterium]MYB82807.1 type I-E CRISPR-associated protein Cas7/Cse4/CasC [Acidimicrobiales bacterium]MYI12088.1 type I-E CRISPR-associated protein Cas7/Cse4/CasC [Acidimicrobiales bacterium]MYK55308.1 type I-E CRISPR-associated protein Cas7/Cse4/CasC [Acidimicrobiia bacterium]